MIKSNELIEEINTILNKVYPIKNTKFKNIYNLSHFSIRNNYEDLYICFKFNILGKILNGEYLGYQIIKVNDYKWKEYLLLYQSFSNITENPIISSKFLFNLHKKNKIDILLINNMTIKHKNEYFIIDIKYQSNPLIKIPVIKELNITNKKNHFYFSSFQINNNKDQIRTELMRLFVHRDEYKSIHIHLRMGGDSSPGQLLVKCLLGNNTEEWMEDVIKYYKEDNKNKSVSWDSWHEYENKKHNWKRIQLLELDYFPLYENKYSGKIHLYLNDCGSAAWYTATYLIYSFATKIKRFTKKYLGKKIKFGKVSQNSQIILHGKSSTCSGDGNQINTNFNSINISYPTIQFKSRSFNKIDWNRFWVEN
jgi:hypothetical protein